MPYTKNVHGVDLGLGFVLALLVLFVVLVFALTGHELSRDWILGGFAALALAILLP